MYLPTLLVRVKEPKEERTNMTEVREGDILEKRKRKGKKEKTGIEIIHVERTTDGGEGNQCYGLNKFTYVCLCVRNGCKDGWKVCACEGIRNHHWREREEEQ